MKYIKKNIIIISLLIIFILIGISLLNRKENLENIINDIDIKKNQDKINKKINNDKPQRYMYMTSGIKRNSSYDTRGDLSKMVFEPEKTGVFYNSVLNNNHINQML